MKTARRATHDPDVLDVVALPSTSTNLEKDIVVSVKLPEWSTTTVLTPKDNGPSTEAIQVRFVLCEFPAGSFRLVLAKPGSPLTARSKYRLLKFISVGLSITTLMLISDHLGTICPEVNGTPSTNKIAELYLTLELFML